jgi:hypothetical protein
MSSATLILSQPCTYPLHVILRGGEGGVCGNNFSWGGSERVEGIENSVAGMHRWHGVSGTDGLGNPETIFHPSKRLTSVHESFCHRPPLFQ